MEHGDVLSPNPVCPSNERSHVEVRYRSIDLLPMGWGRLAYHMGDPSWTGWAVVEWDSCYLSRVVCWCLGGLIITIIFEAC